MYTCSSVICLPSRQRCCNNGQQQDPLRQSYPTLSLYFSIHLFINLFICLSTNLSFFICLYYFTEASYSASKATTAVEEAKLYESNSSHPPRYYCACSVRNRTYRLQECHQSWLLARDPYIYIYIHSLHYLYDYVSIHVFICLSISISRSPVSIYLFIYLTICIYLSMYLLVFSCLICIAFLFLFPSYFQ